MAKHGDKKLRPILPATGTKLYSKKQVAKIIAAAGLEIPQEQHGAIGVRLEEAHERHQIQLVLLDWPTASELQESFARIEGAANKLLDELGAGPTGSLDAIPKSIFDRLHSAAIKKAAPHDGNGRSLLQELVAGVVQIKLWSREFESVEAKRENERRKLSGVKFPRRSKSRTQRYWINELFQIYQGIGGRQTSVTVTVVSHEDEPAGAQTGEFFNFVRSSFAAVGVDLKDDALTKVIQGAKKIRSEN